GVAAVVVATVVSVPVSTVSPAVRLSASSLPCTDTDVTCALILGPTSVPTPDDYYVETVRNQFIAPTHPGQIGYVAVTTPEELWPLTGVTRLLFLALGPPELFGLGGPAWPDEPLWKLSGLFDLTGDQSVQAGVADLEDAIAKHPNEHLVIFGYSQGAGVANEEKRKLAEQYPAGTEAPDIDFVLLGDPNLPNGGWLARFPGLYVPILDWSFNGPAPTDTQFDTVEINRQYDGFSELPLYPLNGISLLNAVLGAVYVHGYLFDVSLAGDPSDSMLYQGTHGDTDYYFFENPDLPLFGPLRTLGVPEPAIDVVEPFFKVLVDLGYDRSIPPWEPTPARLIPPLDPATVAADLVDAVGEGINNAAALIGSPAPRTTLNRVSREVGDGVSQVLTAVRSQLPKPLAVTRDDLQAPQRTVDRELAATGDQINDTIGAVKSVIGDGRTIVRSAGGHNRSNPATTSRARKTPVRDTVTTASSDIKKVVTKVPDRIQTTLSGGNDHDDDKGDGGEGAAQ